MSTPLSVVNCHSYEPLRGEESDNESKLDIFGKEIVFHVFS